MQVHYDIQIIGRVQGVYYRASAQAEGSRLGLSGFVRNEEDGSVYAEAEGEKEALDRFVAWCRRGSSRAKVEDVRFNPGEIRGFRGFHAR